MNEEQYKQIQNVKKSNLKGFVTQFVVSGADESKVEESVKTASAISDKINTKKAAIREVIASFKSKS